MLTRPRINMAPGATRQQVEELTTFLERYYQDECWELARGSADVDALYVQAADLYQFDLEMWENVAINRLSAMLDEAMQSPDLCQGQIPEGTRAYIVDERDGSSIRTLSVPEITSDDIEEYVGVRGQLAAVTKIRSFPKLAGFVCSKCKVRHTVPQNTKEFQTPSIQCECQSKPQWQIDHEQTEWVDHRKLKIQQPPDETADGETQDLTAHIYGPAINDRHGTPLIERVGDEVTVYGKVRLKQQDGRNTPDFLFNSYLDGTACVFEDSGVDSVDIEAHRDEIEAHAQADDVYERLYTSLAPQIYPTDQMELAMKVCAAYLFAAPRINPDDGPMYRGDMHAALIGDPGMAKSVLLDGVSEFSPDGEHRSATGLSSDVGLVAAAVEDDFGEGGWTLKPGILVRSGMHAVIDEIDKGPDNLEKINDALEGRQIATIDKAGIKADLKTRTGLLASGNPEGSRFTTEQPLGEQVDIDPSLLSRFDAIVLLMDNPDEETDRQVASHITQSFREGVKMERGEVEETREEVSRTVSPEVGRAWVALGRQITPQLTETAAEKLEEFYVEVRDFNQSEERISATARQLEAGIRFAMAFARMRLSETVEERDVDMAISVSKDMIGQTFDGDENEMDIDMLTSDGNSHSGKMKRLKSAIPSRNSEPKTAEELASEANLDPDWVAKRLEKLSNEQGEIIFPNGRGNGVTEM